VRDWRCISFAKRDVLQQIRNGVPFTPAKINVRQFASLVSQKKQDAAIAFGTAGDSVRRILKPSTLSPLIFNTPENSDASPGVTSKNRIGSPAGMWLSRRVCFSLAWY
jgi:hypothetical protein